MVAGLVVAPLAGLGGFAPLWLPVLACLAFSMLTMGIPRRSPPGDLRRARRAAGVTLAVHSVVGFGGGLVGPLAVGGVLDLTAGWGEGVSWLAAFLTMAFGSMAGLAILARWKMAAPN